jgi:hypothetical protein
MPAQRDANLSAARVADISALATAARVAVVASYGRNARVKTGAYLRNVKTYQVRDNKFKVRNYIVTNDDDQAISIEYGHKFRRKDGSETGKTSRPTFIMTSAWASFPGA